MVKSSFAGLDCPFTSLFGEGSVSWLGGACFFFIKRSIQAMSECPFSANGFVRTVESRIALLRDFNKARVPAVTFTVIIFFFRCWYPGLVEGGWPWSL
jgi:hypothetical protein